MNLQKILEGVGIVAVGETAAYGIWSYFPRTTDYEEMARPIFTLAIGLTLAIIGGRRIRKGYDEPTPRN
ncbi:MAG: hypothetical protein Q7S27_03345 [Nanoarchaeota archaeon]|nr:hypothetical protein [Nanoarchaeota archaeon]